MVDAGSSWQSSSRLRAVNRLTASARCRDSGMQEAREPRQRRSASTGTLRYGIELTAPSLSASKARNASPSCWRPTSRRMASPLAEKASLTASTRSRRDSCPRFGFRLRSLRARATTSGFVSLRGFLPSQRPSRSRLRLRNGRDRGFSPAGTLRRL